MAPITRIICIVIAAIGLLTNICLLYKRFKANTQSISAALVLIMLLVQMAMPESSGVYAGLTYTLIAINMVDVTWPIPRLAKIPTAIYLIGVTGYGDADVYLSYGFVAFYAPHSVPTRMLMGICVVCIGAAWFMHNEWRSTCILLLVAYLLALILYVAGIDVLLVVHSIIFPTFTFLFAQPVESQVSIEWEVSPPGVTPRRARIIVTTDSGGSSNQVTPQSDPRYLTPAAPKLKPITPAPPVPTLFPDDDSYDG